MFIKKMSLAIIAMVMCCLYSCQINPSTGNTDLHIQDTLPAGTTDILLTIQGKGFSHVTTDNKVMVDDVEAQIISATDNELVVRIPARKTAKIAVTVKVGSEVSDTVLIDNQIVMLAGR
ncbi:IPT/TIG domain-containing protein [Chitinophaga rhizophila]|uniref:IPT/TIG domain-containing protein n=1 Tax=Chitinophaga rhizophila TaxID=2866212 RepID=A0ABS7GET4_9BACT|nr:IPT/TIG domain-containing protein [Chitinophaga rhizophila]MBW8686198.1 IPT/TIG domain-containing protein [Chitinophaga rhizophila]